MGALWHLASNAIAECGGAVYFASPNLTSCITENLIRIKFHSFENDFLLNLKRWSTTSFKGSFYFQMMTTIQSVRRDSSHLNQILTLKWSHGKLDNIGHLVTLEIADDEVILRVLVDSLGTTGAALRRQNVPTGRLRHPWETLKFLLSKKM